MALDFCIRNNHDEIIISVPMSYDSFYDIIEKSKSKSDSTIIGERLIHYFNDAEFYINELSILKAELKNLVQDFINVEKTREVIYLLIQLCDIASHLNKTISVFAD
ncbi:MAG: hypothetical protein ABIU77_20245 [Ferruginibacter sp.]